jgi:hypothetical protein
MANKHRVNRFLCIKLVEFFKLNDFDYTWSGIKRHFDMTKILNELDTLGSSAPFDNEVRSYLLGPIALEKRWITHDYQVELDYAVTNYGGNEWTWKNGLDKLFLNSATSLITEPVSYQKVALFTEKTLYSVFGLNFPIWIGGGYNQANEWKKIGFDVFDDVIDHSYQSYDSLIERCYYAFFYNRELLSNKSYAKKMRLQCKNRLLNNRQLLFDNQIKKFIDFEIAKFPIELQQTIPKILKRFGI